MARVVEGVTPGYEAEVAHGRDCVVLMLKHPLTGPRDSIVLAPDAARRLAVTLIEQSAYSETVEE